MASLTCSCGAAVRPPRLRCSDCAASRAEQGALLRDLSLAGWSLHKCRSRGCECRRFKGPMGGDDDAAGLGGGGGGCGCGCDASQHALVQSAAPAPPPPQQRQNKRQRQPPKAELSALLLECRRCATAARSFGWLGALLAPLAPAVRALGEGARAGDGAAADAVVRMLESHAALATDARRVGLAVPSAAAVVRAAGALDSMYCRLLYLSLSRGGGGGGPLPLPPQRYVLEAVAATLRGCDEAAALEAAAEFVRSHGGEALPRAGSADEAPNELLALYLLLERESAALFRGGEAGFAQLLPPLSGEAAEAGERSKAAAEPASRCVGCLKPVGGGGGSAKLRCGSCGEQSCRDCAASCSAAGCRQAMCVLCAADHPTGEDDAKLCPLHAEPVCTPGLAARRDACRDWWSHLFAYAVPTEEAVLKIASLAPVVEIGAGLGYWAALVRAKGARIEAYDIRPAPSRHGGGAGGASAAQVHNEYHGNCPAFTPLKKGGPAAVLKHKGWPLFLCYPPPDSQMALQCLRNFSGKVLIYAGEWSGFTATRRFESELLSRFALSERIELPNWGSTAYSLTIWTKRGGGGEAKACVAHDLARAELIPAACGGCGCSKAGKLRRCRLCRMTHYCSARCEEGDRGRHAAEHGRRLVCGVLPEFADSRAWS